jgi:hypothetical protein
VPTAPSKKICIADKPGTQPKGLEVLPKPLHLQRLFFWL